MCSPGAYQPNDAFQPGTGPNGFGGPNVASTAGGMISNQGQLPTAVNNPVSPVNKTTPVINPQLFQSKQQAMNGVNPGFGAMKIIK